MQVISLLNREQAPSTERCWWRRRKPDYIDVSEIKPNPIVAWVKAKWKRTVAIIITRIARCWRNTEPGGFMLVGMGIMLGIIFSTFPLMVETYTFNHIIWSAMCLSVKFVALFVALLYGCWEFYQGCKWLRKWAGKHYYEKESQD